MKKLQNNFTTPEQSKRLLELGVPADSADMYYKQYSEAVVCVGEVGDVPQGKTFYIHEPDLRHINPKETWTWKNGKRLDLSGKVDELRKTDIPCWSVGRLIEIYETSCLKRVIIDFENVKYVHERQSNLVEDLIVCIEGHKIMSELYPHFYKLDFSKLEEINNENH